MRRLSGLVVCLVSLLVMVAGATPVYAAAPSGCHPGKEAAPSTVVIGGRVYGAKDGVKVETFQCEIVPGSGSVGGVFGDKPQGPGSVTPQMTWGSSYAISTEQWTQLGYDAKEKAAANIYNGKRIIQVCMWYTRGSSIVSSILCSTAASTGGSWMSGPQVTNSVQDSWNPWDVKTIFRYSLVQINP